MNTTKYKELLEYSYDTIVKTYECPPVSRLDYLGEYIFDFTTYDSDASELFAAKAVEVCVAINNKSTFEYIENKNNYNWFLLMCNMPFFANKIEWGSSIRSAWWNTECGDKIKLQSTGLWENENQLIEIQFAHEEWKNFITAIIEFSQES